MLSRVLHRLAVGVAVGSTQLAAAFGGEPVRIGGYLVATALGGVLYLQGDRRLVGGRVFPNVMIGYALGIAASLGVGAGLLMMLLGVPWDLALWRTGILMWASWAGIGVALVSAYFVVGLAVASF